MELSTVICKALARMSQFNHYGLRLKERLTAKIASVWKSVCASVCVCVLYTFSIYTEAFCLQCVLMVRSIK